jgi:hypothetical protein
VVPPSPTRIRVQVSASHTPEELDFAADQFLSAKQELAL